ncbi:AAA family ATPase [Oscillatoria sp. CS-180]|uniref:R3H domain-containing nucleic acid-binding protein n=1 Tax=Oscillatoria sp. CS-180 TaxID=3021720 RepID=UPI00232C1BFF|nr:R3H domain-containing nucleic acid-binding protein [Oscillatoria sp. CS-180]MDB9524613.1 AAA family ATPase [Oscillatoria sp. CS-180]
MVLQNDAQSFDSANYSPSQKGVQQSSQSAVYDDLQQLIHILPPDIAALIRQHSQANQLIEVILDLGRRPEARFPSGSDYLSDAVVTKEDLQYCIDRVGFFGGDNRAGIEKTLHRISAIRNRSGEVIGLTCRVGRAVFGTIGLIRDLVERGQSILMLGRPGVGKTTALREIARVLADDLDRRVVIIDTSNEIAGDGDIPHPAIGRARRMQVAKPELQHQVMIEAVENHMPEVIVIDEIGTELEATAARTIAERGVQLVGTAHGNQLENLIKNPTLSDLVGGIQSVTLGDDEARRRGSQKSVLERKAPPTFDIAIEMLERQRWVVHENVSDTVDFLLRGRKPAIQIRTVNEQGEIVVTTETPKEKTTPILGRSSSVTGFKKTGGWRSSGRMMPPKGGGTVERLPLSSDEQDFEAMLNHSLDDAALAYSATDAGTALSSAPEPEIGPNGEDILRVYSYGISKHHLDQVIETLRLPVILTKDLDAADAVLALRSHVKHHSKLRQIAKVRHLPIHTVKSNSMPQIVRTLQRMLDLDESSVESMPNLSLLSPHEDADELEALEEARLAVEQIVIPKGQPVELLPRSARIRKMQHELAEHYRLKSCSFGDEPNRRLRIYPA